MIIDSSGEPLSAAAVAERDEWRAVSESFASRWAKCTIVSAELR